MDARDYRLADELLRRGWIDFGRWKELQEECERTGSALLRVLRERGLLDEHRLEEALGALDKPASGGRIRSDDEFCAELVRREFLGTAQLAEAMRLQEKYRRGDRVLKSLDEILIEMGYVTVPQIISIRGAAEGIRLSEQTSLRLGDLVVRRGLVRPERVQECLRIQEEEQRRAGVRPLGQIMVDRGYITPEQLDWLLTRPGRRLGELAVAQGFCSPEQIAECLKVQEEENAKNKSRRIGEILLEKGYLDPFQLELLLNREGLRLGDIAMREGLITRAQLEECLAIQEEERRKSGASKLGEILLAKGYIDAYQLHELLTRPGKVSPKLEIRGYEILDRVAEGAMGEVYRARQMSVDRIVAVKVLPLRHARNGAALERFVQEARMLGRLDHPNLVKVFDTGRVRDTLYIVMEFVEGTTVERLLEYHGSLPVRQCLNVGIAVARALEHLHANRLVHRDLKPSNLLVTRQGNVKIIDLGVATLGSMASGGSGSPLYMSPEACAGEAVDERADLYSLGATLYHCATGRPPFQAPTPEAVMAMHMYRTAIPPDEVRPEIPKELSDVIMSLLEKAREKRPAGAGEVAALLERVRDSSDQSIGSYRVRTWRVVEEKPASQRGVPWGILAAVAAALAAAAMAWILWST